MQKAFLFPCVALNLRIVQVTLLMLFEKGRKARIKEKAKKKKNYYMWNK